MFRLLVLCSGGGTNLQAIIDNIENGNLKGVEIAKVIVNNADAFALKRAEKHGIDASVVSPKSYDNRDLFNAALKEAIDAVSPDLIVLAGYLVVVPPAVITAYRNRIINIHPSLIPSFCGKGFYGLKVHEEALKRGVKVTGATVHFVDEGTDTGPIIIQKAVYIEEGDTPEVLQKRVMEQAEWIILSKAIGLIAEGRVTVSDGVAHIR